MRWKKLGLVVRPKSDVWWMTTHAMVPTVEHVEGSYFRIYFSGRDKQNRSHIGCIIFDVSTLHVVSERDSELVLSPGELGCFDDNGVTPSWIVNHGGKKFLYYIGWNKGSTVRMHLFTGLAISSDESRTFQRYQRVPLLDRIDTEPFIITAPCIRVENDLWRMWYVAGIKWADKDQPYYHIRYAKSQDGIHWSRHGVVCIDLASSHEHALARPCVLKEDGIYKMWYSYKGSAYRIGYAESPDGTAWVRMDEQVGIGLSNEGWDSEMMEYAYVFHYGSKKYMLYNGNNYGQGGIGLAVWDDE